MTSKSMSNAGCWMLDAPKTPLADSLPIPSFDSTTLFKHLCPTCATVTAIQPYRLHICTSEGGCIHKLEVVISTGQSCPARRT